ncbi:CFI-box-CTERM domain-containing protein [Microbulbifer sp. THAF38]|uniref:CFI-box-CTERM domain-containing protein n=1 Tax=Microbulbifer sp. THAF38 TaxID=2587856 RepID=UPI00126955B4|nr:CFI-box-CTERM domain-containing protein [Microbulbifer sp. THAF38]
MGNSGKKKWVSASDVGRASYCPHYLELKEKGAKPSQQSLEARAKGETSHEALNRQAEDQRCFVATHLYGINHPNTCLLRVYRDQQLASHFRGRVFIRIYYALSPLLVIASRKFPMFSRVMRYFVDRQICRIQERREDD